MSETMIRDELTPSEAKWLYAIGTNPNDEEVFKSVYGFLGFNPSPIFKERAEKALKDHGRMDEYQKWVSNYKAARDRDIAEVSKRINRDALKKSQPYVSKPKTEEPAGQFEMVAHKDSDPTIKQSIENCVRAIEQDELLKGRLFYNEMQYSPFVLCPIPWDASEGLRVWSPADDDNLQSYIESKYGLKCLSRIMQGFNIVIHNHTINPVKEALCKCYEVWDGKTDHISGLLPSMLGAEPTRYNATALKIWMLGGICRTFNPGCKFDSTIILAGPQGIGKTTFLEKLAMKDEWFSGISSLDSKEAREQLLGNFIIVIDELMAFKSTRHRESAKAFLTARDDNYREAYAKRTVHHPRRCIFAGTTNSDRFLSDLTGERRYLPIACGVIEPTFDLFANDQLTRDEISQAWGEAMNYYYAAKGKPALIMPRDLQDEIKAIHERYAEENSDIGIIQKWLDENHEDQVCIRQIWDEALRNERPPEKRESNEIAEIMRNKIKGWEPAEDRVYFQRYGQQRAYRRKPPLTEAIEAEEVPFT